MALDADQLTDMQADIGISNDEAVFSDVALQRLYTRSESSYPLAVYYAFRQLLAQANKFHDYSVASSSVSRSQLRAHVRDMMDFWQDEAKVAGNQVRIVGGLRIPPRDPDLPDDIRRHRSRYEVNHHVGRIGSA